VTAQAGDVRFALAMREPREGLALLSGQGLAHGRDHEDAPGLPAVTLQCAAEQVRVTQGKRRLAEVLRALATRS
jgi:hypothetical protein